MSDATQKSWKLRDFPPFGFAQELGFTPFHAHLLYNRGVQTAEDAELFLNADERLLNDPKMLPDMPKAVERLRQALDGGEHIAIFGDFDADGITGTALLTTALRSLGAKVTPLLPNRADEGHGLNTRAINLMAEGGASLLITVDCGTTSVDEVDQAAELGIDTIITDHHTVLPQVPASHALINPRHPDSLYPFGGLTGVGMSFKLIEALYGALDEDWPEHLLEFVALGTVADVGPLQGENRFLVKRGLESLNRTDNPGIQALAGSARMNMGTLDTESLSFGIIPRLNVPGRLSDPKVALHLLTTDSADVARSLADEIEHLNGKRQELTHRAVAEAEAQVERQCELPYILIVKSADWIPGILGLIAGRLSEQYYRPAIAISIDGEICRASARSIPEFSIIKAMGESAELFDEWGGHPRAAGFTMQIANLPALEQNLYCTAAEWLDGQSLTPSIDIDCEVRLEAFTPNNVNFILSLGPFGEGNPSPVFLTRGVRVVEARRVGSGGRHLKMRLNQGRTTIDAIAFNLGHLAGVTRREIDVVYSVGLDSWQGRTTLQMTVQDLCASN